MEYDEVNEVNEVNEDEVTDKKIGKSKDDYNIIKRFEKDYESMNNMWSTLHTRHRDSIRFAWFSEQWDEQALNDRNSRASTNGGTPLAPRPTEVFNLVLPFIIKVVNLIKKMKPSLKVLPVDGESDKVLADVRRGIMKHIENNTGAIPARENALTDAVSAGFGFYRFVTDFADPKSFEQEIKYKIIEDATTVLWDENSKEPDGSDCMKCIVQEKYSKAEFKAEFKMDWSDAYIYGETSQVWGTDNSPVVSEYWYIEESPKKLVMLKQEFGGRNVYLSEAEKMSKESGINIDYMLQIGNDGEYVQRDTTTRQVWWCKMAGKRVLTKQKWAGYWIPIFKVDGRKKKIGGKLQMNGLVHDAKPSCKAYNYARNQQIERMALSTKSPYITPVGSIPPNAKHMWDSANSRNWSMLPYNPYDKNMKPIPPPSRTAPAQIDPAFVNEAMTAQNEIKATIGLYGSFVGDSSRESSGRAILAGAEESSDVVFDFVNNLSNTMGFEGRVINELIPKIYDTKRQIKMVGEDDVEKVVWINQKAMNEKGEEYYYDMNRGKFDIVSVMGPSDITKRQESRTALEGLVKAAPIFAPMLADLIVEESDASKKDIVAKRLKNVIKKQYPGVIDEDEEGQPSPELMEAKKIMDGMNAQIQELTMNNQQLMDDKQLDVKKIQIDEFKAKTERMKVASEADNKQKELKIDIAKTEMENDRVNLQNDRESQQMIIDSRKNDVVDLINNVEDTVNNVVSDIDNKLSIVENEIGKVSQELQALPEQLVIPTPEPVIAEPQIINVTVEAPITNNTKKTIKKNKDGGFDVISEEED